MSKQIFTVDFLQLKTELQADPEWLAKELKRTGFHWNDRLHECFRFDEEGIFFTPPGWQCDLKSDVLWIIRDIPE